MTGPNMPPELPLSTYRSVIDDLLNAWSKVDVKGGISNMPVARIVFVLAARVHAEASAATYLWDGGFGTESLAVARVCFESAVYAAWVQQNGRAAVEAFLRGRFQQGRAVVKEFDRLGIPVPDEVRNAVDSAPLLADPPPLGDRPGNFKSTCEDLDSSLYATYRFLADEAHPGISLTRHLAEGSDGELVHLVRAQRGDEALRIGAEVVAQSLVWGGRAFDETGVADSRRDLLDAAAERLGIPPQLTSSGNCEPRTT